MKFTLIKYADEYEKTWDQFVFEQALNGTFLQSKRFLNYHPKERFEDASYLVFDEKGHLAALCPGCKCLENELQIFYSHKGSTFGGIIIDSKNYEIEKIINIIEALQEQLIKDSYQKVILKITPDIFFTKDTGDLLQFCLYYLGYQEQIELNLMVDYSTYKDNILSNFSQGKRTNIYNCIRAGMQLRELLTDDEIAIFYDILCITLKKYELKPVHKLHELLEFKNDRLYQECGFYGIYYENKMIAGSMMFYFQKANVAHTQYLCALHEYDRLSPMSFMYFQMINEMKIKGYKALTWGIVTENSGKYINMGLAKSKAAFGSKYFTNKTYIKYFNL